jgi:hypothetical protein
MYKHYEKLEYPLCKTNKFSFSKANGTERRFNTLQCIRIVRYYEIDLVLTFNIAGIDGTSG